MQFRLTYEGKLLANGHARHKHEIRKVFHSQLRRLWEISPSLKEMRDWVLDSAGIDHLPDRSRIEGLAERFSRNNHNFVPLVTSDLAMSFCGIDILYLRPGAPGAILRSSDIDNRLKTLFDALKMPEGKNDFGGYDWPKEDEKPFYCLLQDDSLVTKVSVETDFLLEPVGKNFDANDARVVISVTTQPANTWLDVRFHSAQ
jgi:hypothetical protein